MSLFVTNETAIDPITGIPVQLGFVIATESGDYISTSPTGAPRYSLNTLPGTDQNFPTQTTTTISNIFLETTDPNSIIPGTDELLGTQAMDILATEDGSELLVLEESSSFGPLENLLTENGAPLLLDPDTVISRPIIGLPYGFVDVPSTGVLY